MNIKTVISRPINGISLNGNEYLLNEEGNTMLFNNKDEAKAFLIEHGAAPETIDYEVSFDDIDMDDLAEDDVIPFCN